MAHVIRRAKELLKETAVSEPEVATATAEVADDSKTDSEIESEGDPEPSKTEVKATSDDKQEAEDAHPDTSVSADVAKESAPSDVAKKSETP